MWYWAQQSAATLAQKVGDMEMAAYWHDRAAALADLLQARAWNSAQGVWQEYLEEHQQVSSYPNALAVLSGLAHADQKESIRQCLSRCRISGTPFMYGFMLLALSQTGGTHLLPERIEEFWGGMLAHGATTFWEDFKIGETEHYSMYERPFGRSLCHAWSSGPAAILPAELLGIRPLSDGWKTFTVRPVMGNLQWAAATVPTPAGAIEVEADTAQVKVKIPEGLALRYGDQSYRGHATFQLSHIS